MRKPLLALAAFTLLFASCTPLDRKITDELTEAERKELIAAIPPEDLKHVEFLVGDSLHPLDSSVSLLRTTLKGTDATYRDLIEQGRRLEGK
jgi:hypothetical protein